MTRMAIKVFLLGQFKLESNGIVIDLPSRPAQSLLAYLILNSGVVYRREKLASLFWMDSTEANARGYLRQALWRIRKAFGDTCLDSEEYLEISDINICFRPSGEYWLDAAEFLKVDEDLAIDEMIERVKLYQGELLPGFYDDWVLPERDRFQAAYQQRMTILLDKLIQEKRWNDAIQQGESWLQLGYSPEPAFRALMQAYAGLGDPTMVSNIYQRCINQLDSELGLDPSPETRCLYDRILQEGQSVNRHGELRQPKREMELPDFMREGVDDHVESQIFVSRESELARLQDHLEGALHRQGKVIFLTGEAGSGKTALVAEFAHRVLEEHPEVGIVTGNCNAHTGLGDPYLPFREVLEMLTGDVESRWAAGTISSQHARFLWKSIPITAQAIVSAGPGLIYTLLQSNSLLERACRCTSGEPDWLARLATLVSSAQTEGVTAKPLRADLFDQYSRVLVSIAKSTPLLIILDDLQWADPGSINLLFYLGRQITGSQILVVGAYRPEEVAIGRDGERHPLETVVSELQRISGDIPINLDHAENRDFLEALIDSEPNQLEVSFRDMLFRQTRGHPLFTLELLRGLQERGDLVLDVDHNWVEGGTLNWEKLPARVEAVIMERINRLPSVLQRALRIASIEGEVFTAEVVAEVMGISSMELLTQLSEELDRKHRLVRAHSIQRVKGKLVTGYRFRHIQIQKYLYGSLNQVERVHLHEQVGYSLEKLHGMELSLADLDLLFTTETPVMQLARHFQKARISDKAIHYLHLAGERAVQLSAYGEGYTYITQALEILLSQPVSVKRAKQELTLQLSLGKARKGITSMAFTEVEYIYERALDLCDQVGNPLLECQILGELLTVFYVRGNYLIAREYGQKLNRRADELGDPLTQAIAGWLNGFLLFVLGEFVSSRENLEKMLEFYNQSEHFSKFVYLHGVDSGLSAMAYYACCLWCLGYPDQAQEVSDKALKLGQAANHPFTYADVLTYAGCLFYELKRHPVKVKSLAEDLIYLAELVGISWRGAGLRFKGGAMAQLGDLEGGLKEARLGMSGEVDIASYCNISSTLGVLALAHLNAGQFDISRELLESAFELIEEKSERYCEVEIHRIQAEMLLKMGDESAAEGSYQKALEVARLQEAKSHELRVATSLARLWQQQGKIQEAYDLLFGIYNWFTEGFGTPDLLAAKALLDELS
ncbi:MAG: AAA family ATPase [Anaerolineales bacterium]